MTTQTKPVSFTVSKKDRLIIKEIIRRARSLGLCSPDEVMDAHMDITACHANGCKLDLIKLSEAPQFDFCHDIAGIKRHLNRKSGELMDCFLPRCAL